MDEIIEMIGEDRIKIRVSEIANQINRDYNGEELFVICTLKGATLFTSDLIRKLDMPVILDFMRASSYNDGTVSTGVVKILKDLDNPINDKNVLIVDDIVDTGNTLHSLMELLKTRNPKTIEVCTLLDKPDRREKNVNVRYSGFSIPDEFVIGYGLDYDQRYRNLPYIAKIKKKEL